MSPDQAKKGYEKYKSNWEKEVSEFLKRGSYNISIEEFVALQKLDAKKRKAERKEKLAKVAALRRERQAKMGKKARKVVKKSGNKTKPITKKAVKKTTVKRKTVTK